MWNIVLSEINLTDGIKQTLAKARSKDTQRAHCAALARFVWICENLALEWRNLSSWDALHTIAIQVLDWAGKNEAPIYWLKKIRSAISVLYAYKFGKAGCENAIVDSVVHVYTLQQLPVRIPLRLKWDLSQLLTYIEQMGDNQDLTHVQLTRKCVALVMATTGARFSEVAQFSLNATDPQEEDTRWDFMVKIKNREYLQPVELHAMKHIGINTIAAMKDLRERIRTKRKEKHKEEDTFWYDEHWNVMNRKEISIAAKQLLHQAGIDETRPYHIKHAAVTWLSQHGVAPDWIVRFLRHKQSSTVYVDYYLSEDMGAMCNRTIERTALRDDATSNSALHQHVTEREPRGRRRQPMTRRVRRKSV
jgi:site-specific recombinase XerD